MLQKGDSSIDPKSQVQHEFLKIAQLNLSILDQKALDYTFNLLKKLKSSSMKSPGSSLLVS